MIMDPIPRPILAALLFAVATGSLPAADESLLPLVEGKVPVTQGELWDGYDPRKEPLETEVMKEWEEDGAVLRVVRYQAGIFKGRKVMVAGIYGFPKGGTKLPGLLQIHGGGQFADYQAPLKNAKRGYATFSLAWAGRISAPGYQVPSEVVNLFIEGKTTDPAYRVTTDWVGFDGYHAVDRKGRNPLIAVPWKLDDGRESPRNAGWFMWAIAARRALTFLEQQPEVDGNQLGVYGHSMGGKLTVMVASSDHRVKAAAPSCGGQHFDPPKSPTDVAISDPESIKHITCPIIFLNPSNDFHATITGVEQASLALPATTGYRFTRDPNLNHRTQSNHVVCGLLWFDQQLKGTFRMPETPKTTLALIRGNNPAITVVPDTTKPVLSVEVYYTQGEKSSERHWQYAKARKEGDAWIAELKVLARDKSLMAYANVTCPLDTPVTGASYYYETYSAKAFTLSSHLHTVTPEQMKDAGIAITDQSSLVIEDFAPDWQKEWYMFNYEGKPPFRTRKLADAKWAAPEYAVLALEVRNPSPMTLRIELDTYGADVAVAGTGTWETIRLHPRQFTEAKGGPGFTTWKRFSELSIGPKQLINADRPEIKAGDIPMPEMRALRWIPVSREEFTAPRPD